MTLTFEHDLDIKMNSHARYLCQMPFSHDDSWTWDIHVGLVAIAGPLRLSVAIISYWWRVSVSALCVCNQSERAWSR